MSIAVSQERRLAQPATPAEIAAIPVELKLRTPRKLWQRLSQRSIKSRESMNSIIRHLIETHPDMAGADNA